MNKIKRCLLLTFIVCFIVGCDLAAPGAAGGSQTEESSAGGEHIHMTEDGEYYTFLDVEGNSYEAPLLENVPKCTYDFQHLTTDETTGYKSFRDEENNVTAKFGIDVSEFQGEEIDWKQVKDSGVEFVIIRLGYRAYGESGALVLDAMYEKNIQGATDAGLDVGVYFFSQAISGAEAVEEADFVLEHLNGYDITGPVVYDTEEIKWDTARTDNNTKQDFTNFCKVFCDTIEHAGYDTMIYSNMTWMAYTLDMEELAEYDFWYADYYDTPQCPYDYQIWQYSESGVVPGINANVDLNLWFEKGE
nr:glycoside hydrolase family 25 protein [uncultured Mediterraneibacter sp.]